MKNFTKALVFFLLSILFTACNKEKNSPAPLTNTSVEQAPKGLAATTFHLVKQGVIQQPASAVNYLAFDKSGTIYGLQDPKAYGYGYKYYKSVFKYVNGVPKTIYTVPADYSDPTVEPLPPNPDVINYYTYGIIGLVTDSIGNVYIGLNQYRDFYNDLNYGSTFYINTSIIKITPDGNATTLVTNLNSESFGYEIHSHKENMAIDNHNNIYFDAYNYYRTPFTNDTTLYTHFYQISTTGVVNIFIKSFVCNNIATDKAGNVYINDSSTITKFTRQGVTSVIAGPYADKNLGSMVTDSGGNLIVVNGKSVLLINPAGNISSINTGFTLGTLAIDKSDNIYHITSAAITKYSYK